MSVSTLHDQNFLSSLLKHHHFEHFPRIGNVFLRAITLCGSAKIAMPTLDALENKMVGVHSTMSSSIHEMSSILAQFQPQEQVKKKL
jgi:hypothetical protein